eukprot:TRINITY_DN64338_c0_g2_i2.p1 TRINITY_DN64338_c0_g2~~TRINITY_DN64338_c0_g2_i2.p1  ORF type:complete len:346 (+),score=97.13 TRINITY_DN64338_c0_g2_i2:57-1094(+)
MMQQSAEFAASLPFKARNREADLQMQEFLSRLQAEVGALWKGLAMCREETAALAEQLMEQGLVKSSFLVSLFRRRLEVPPALDRAEVLLQSPPVEVSAPTGWSERHGLQQRPEESSVSARRRSHASADVGGSPVAVSESGGRSTQDVLQSIKSLAQQTDWSARAESLIAKYVEDAEQEEEQRFLEARKRRAKRQQVVYDQISSSSEEDAADDTVVSSQAAPGAAAAGHLQGSASVEVRSLKAAEVPSSPRLKKPLHVYVCGGTVTSVGSGQVLGTWCVNTFDRFDVGAGAWELLPPMQRARAGTACGFMSGHIFICGGCFAPDGDAVSLVEKYDIRTSMWEVFCR